MEKKGILLAVIVGIFPFVVQSHATGSDAHPSSSFGQSGLTNERMYQERFAQVSQVYDQAEKREIQSALQLLGFYRGPIDGVFGAGTTAAIRRFQEALNVPVTGELDGYQHAALMFASATKRANPQMPVAVIISSTRRPSGLYSN